MGDSKLGVGSRIEHPKFGKGVIVDPDAKLEEELIVSIPLTLMEPVLLGMIPIKAFKVVVRPAPLRPSSATHSPLLTLKCNPCRICAFSYQALRFLTSITFGRSTLLFL